jgi:hypothetical protein
MVLTAFLYLNVIHYAKYKEAIHASSEAWLTENIPNENVDNKFSAHNAFLG